MATLFFLPAVFTDVFLLAGQSNAQGDGEFLDAALDGPLAGVFQLNQSNAVVAAQEPMDNSAPIADHIGFSLKFGKTYLAALSRQVLVVPCAIGGTGFSNNIWNPGDSGYVTAVARANAAMAVATVPTFKGILWHQGETDAIAGWTQTQYANALGAMVTAMRAAITGASVAPFVCGAMSVAFTDGAGATHGVRDALANAPNTITRCAWTDSAGLTTNVGDTIHFDAPSQRIFGGRYYASWASL